MRMYFVFFFALLLSSCYHQKETKVDFKGPDKAPGSWMYDQRAYPNGINKEGKALAEKQFLAMKNNPATRFDEPWEQVGPTNVGGRITDIALHPTAMNIIYAGSSVGGVWKSVDKGVSWSLIFDQPGGLSIGNIGLSTSDPNTIYIGTGEANGSATSGAFFGNGIYKSEDAGASWINVGLEESDHIGRIVVHPDDSDIAYVAATGILYGKNEERGIYMTIDGGQTWDQKLYVSDSTAAIDISLSPEDPDVLFASMWERTRFAEGRVYGGTTTGLYRSKDAGVTWELMTNGLPNNDPSLGRIGVFVSPSDPNIVYTTLTDDPIRNRFKGIYKSEDQGDSWIEMNGDELGNSFSSFGWFFGNVRVHPTNPEDVFIVGFLNYSMQDTSWSSWSNGYHVDQHAYEMHPLDPNYRVFGNDGGIYITEDAGNTIRHVETIANNQFYECKIHPVRTETYLAGAQDNGTLRTNGEGINGYIRISGGDGFVVQFDQVDPTIFYVESQWGNIRRAVEISEEEVNTVTITPESEISQRTNWNTPFITIPNEFGGLFYGAEHVLYSGDLGENWEVISPDLTNGPYPSPGYGTISTLAVSDLNQNIILAGTDDGNAHITIDRGITWTLISEDLPNVSVSSVMTDPFDEATIYITYSGYRSGVYLPHVFRSTDYGESWTDISANLPEIPVNEIVIDPLLENTYYLATDLGVFLTENGGASWETLGEDMPPVVVADLDLDNNQRLLLAATFGRSMYTYGLPSEPTLTSSPIISSLKISPNPAKNTISIQTQVEGEIVEAIIVDLAGKNVKSMKDINAPIDIEELPVGTYVIRLMTKKEIKTAKFVKI